MKVYVVMCEHASDDSKELLAIHATFDGARERMEEIKEYFNSTGRGVTEGVGGALYVCEPSGAPYRNYWVKTMELSK